MRYALIAGLLSFLFAVAVHVYDCQSGTHEQCLMSRGFFWGYWIGSFLVALAVVASVGVTIRWLREMTKLNDDA